MQGGSKWGHPSAHQPSEVINSLDPAASGCVRVSLHDTTQVRDNIDGWEIVKWAVGDYLGLLSTFEGAPSCNLDLTQLHSMNMNRALLTSFSEAKNALVHQHLFP